jgi:tripartite-type tricarboxylate transporter receptor subunit TctC
MRAPLSQVYLVTRALALSVVLALTIQAPVSAAEWPTKPVTIIDPYSAGGTTDFIARVLAKHLSERLGQTFIVENRGGAGSTIGTARMAQSDADGHTLLINNMSIAFSKALYPSLPYDTEKDIAPVALIGSTPTVLATAKSVKADSVEDLISMAKTDPGSLNFGSAGIGSTGHMAMVALQRAADIEIQHIPYKGAGQALTDLIGGRILIMMNTITPMVPNVKAGSIRGLASSGKSRSLALPNVPTVSESGLPGFSYAPWFAFFAPGDTPPDVVEKIHAAIYEAVSDPKVSAKLSQQGIELERASVEEFKARYLSDIKEWTTTINELGIKLQ